jgi:hypothetical protein
MVYDLLWDSFDGKGNVVEPGDENWKGSCKYHLVGLIRGHDFGPPVNHIILSKNHKFLPKLAAWANEEALKPVV